MNTSITAHVARVLRRHFLVRPRHFRPQQLLDKDFNLGPLDMLELALCLEQEFHVDFSDQEVAEFRTFGSVVDSVKRHVTEVASPVMTHFRLVM